jgi:predicted membrane GTPase involved in stress response
MKLVKLILLINLWFWSWCTSLICSYWNNEKRRYELQIGQPQVIIKEIDGKKCEPIEELTIDLPETFR